MADAAAGQTVGSMVSELGPGGARHFLTGTSAPCLSVFKPAPLDGGGGFGPPPGAGFDGASLFWRHERLHRVVLADYAARAAAIRQAQVALEQDALAGGGRGIWETHRSVIPEWIRGASAVPARGRRLCSGCLAPAIACGPRAGVTLRWSSARPCGAGVDRGRRG